MRKTLFWTTLIATLALTAGPALAQTQPPAKAPLPAQGPAAETLFMWNGISHKLIAMAEDFPEDKYNFKPKPEVRTFAEQLLHVAGSDYVLISAVKGSQVGPGTEDPSRETYKTKANVVALLKKAVEDGAALIKEQGDAGLNHTVKFPYGNRMVSSSFCWTEAIEDRKSTRLNSSHIQKSRMPSSA